MIMKLYLAHKRVVDFWYCKCAQSGCSQKLTAYYKFHFMQNSYTKHINIFTMNYLPHHMLGIVTQSNS